MIHEHQQEYYEAINQSNAAANCAPFVEFMLEVILETIQTHQVTHQVTHRVTHQVKTLMSAIDGEMRRSELMVVMKLKDRVNFKRLYLDPTLVDGLIEMIIPDKPNSRMQKYRLTEKGKHTVR